MRTALYVRNCASVANNGVVVRLDSGISWILVGNLELIQQSRKKF